MATFKRYSGSSWVNIANVKRYSSSWVNCSAVKRHNGSSWVNVWTYCSCNCNHCSCNCDDCDCSCNCDYCSDCSQCKPMTNTDPYGPGCY